MSHFASDIKKIYSNKFIRTMLLVLCAMMILDPILTYTDLAKANFPESVGTNPFKFWLLINSSGIGFKFFMFFLYIFPVLSTGLIYFQERNSSLYEILVIKYCKKKYLTSKIITVFLTTFINFLLVLLLNLLVTYILFDANSPTLTELSNFIPKEGMFAEFFYNISPLCMSIMYCALYALTQALLAVLVVGIHMIYKFRSIYSAFIVPYIIIYFSRYLSRFLFGEVYNIQYIIQPLIASNSILTITNSNVIIAFAVLLFIANCVALVGFRRNKDIL